MAGFALRNALRTKDTMGPTRRSAKNGVIATEAAILTGSRAYNKNKSLKLSYTYIQNDLSVFFFLLTLTIQYVVTKFIMTRLSGSSGGYL